MYGLGNNSVHGAQCDPFWSAQNGACSDHTGQYVLPNANTQQVVTPNLPTPAELAAQQAEARKALATDFPTAPPPTARPLPGFTDGLKLWMTPDVALNTMGAAVTKFGTNPGYAAGVLAPLAAVVVLLAGGKRASSYGRYRRVIDYD